MKLLRSTLNELEHSVTTYPGIIGLIGVGSTGNITRMDQYSDLDFFVITDNEKTKARYIKDISWLTNIKPVGYYFQNTKDGYKLFFEDGVYCEFAVFSEQELTGIGPQEYQVLWQDHVFALPPTTKGRAKEYREESYYLGEILTNLYVGISRFKRGEKLSAFKYIQNYAIESLLNLLQVQEDFYDPSRRVEKSDVLSPEILESFMPGYMKSLEAANAILTYLTQHYLVDEWMTYHLIHMMD